MVERATGVPAWLRDVVRRVRWSWVRPSSVSALMDGVIRVERSGHQVIREDDGRVVAEFDGLVKLRPPGERYFGCGERTAGLEKTGTRQVFWNIDPPAGHTASFNNLYTSVPFVLCLHEGRA